MVLFLAFLFFLSKLSPSYALTEFTTTQEITYQFNHAGIAQVSHKTNIVNNFSQFYPTQYGLSLSGSKATDIQAFDSNGHLPIEVKPDNDEIKLSIELPNAKTGKDQATTFNINYKSNKLSHQKGKTWEVVLPQFQDNISNEISVTIIVPTSFGKLSSSPSGANISPNTQDTTITFKKYNPKEKLVLTFGEYQLFNFDLSYQLKNNSSQTNLFFVPLPPDTSYQKVIFSQIDPPPQKIETDADGNWLAYFPIPPNSELKITASGQAKIGHNPDYQFISPPILDNQLYWPTDNPEIIKLAKTHTTPRQIYDYVVSTLNYDFNRVNDSSRRGAATALQNPNSALCTDFTDLFIAIARATGIGAREIEGYAYSNNTDIKPLLTGTDVLHAWPEYYNTKTEKWTPIDPTWGKTTGGINYFDYLDLNHFAFVIHNHKSDSPPPPGSYKTNPNQKSVTATFADSTINVDTRDLIYSTQFNPFSKSYLIIKNPNLFSYQGILPLSEIKKDFPKTSFLSSLLPRNQNTKINDTATIQNPYHFFNLFITIVSSLILLSIGAIILLRKK